MLSQDAGPRTSLTLSAGLAFLGSVALVAWSLPWMTLAFLPILIVIMSPFSDL